jgi:neutral ceramidase
MSERIPRTTAGFALADVTPAVGTPMSGYPAARTDLPWAPDAMRGYMGRHEPARAVHDPLLAGVAAIECDGSTAVVVGIDTLVVTRDFTRRLREALAEDGVDPACVLVAASHTHGGPDVFNWWERHDDGALERRMLSATIEAARRALAARVPAQLAWGTAPLSGVSINRRDEGEGPTDPVVRVLRATAPTGETLGMVVSFACHPVTLDYANLALTADWIAPMRAALAAVHRDAVCVFANGAAGNINPARHPYEQRRVIYVPQTLENRPVYWGGFRDAERVGRSVAGAALVAAEAAVPLAWEAPRGTVAPVELPLKQGEELERFLEFMALTGSYRASLGDRGTVTTEAQAVRLGPLRLVGLPGEPFVELGLALQATAGADPLLVVGFANDDVRYVMTDDAYVAGQYETVGTPLARGSAAVLSDHATELLGSV